MALVLNVKRRKERKMPKENNIVDNPIVAKGLAELKNIMSMFARKEIDWEQYKAMLSATK